MGFTQAGGFGLDEALEPARLYLGRRTGRDRPGPLRGSPEPPQPRNPTGPGGVAHNSSHVAAIMDQDLERFVQAQAGCYAQALDELRSGRKRTHWMWFIFPQFQGLGSSATSRHFAIRSLQEARQYLSHPLLGPRLAECTAAVNALHGPSAHEIFGSPDDLKFRSSMTLFELVAAPDAPFALALERYFSGERDARTLKLTGRLTQGQSAGGKR